MPVAENVEQTVKEINASLSSDPDFVRLREFYASMQREGVAIKHEYSLPPLDTVGSRLYKMSVEKTDPVQ